jgi:hypothetical protein
LLKQIFISIFLCLFYVVQVSGVPNKSKGLTFKTTTYNGWKNTLIVGNGKIEVVIVPIIGRVMQFRFAGEDGPFWENSSLYGKMPDPKSEVWGNFGGDKTWPAPQTDWGKVMNRGWPPPPAFDSMPVDANLKPDGVELVSPIDPFYGIRTRRYIKLDLQRRPVMTITTTYEKIVGDPLKVSIWVITQLNDPVGAYVPIPSRSIYPEGFYKVSDCLPKNLTLKKNLLSLTRDSQTNTKIGSDAGTLLWIGEKLTLRMDSPRELISDSKSKIEYPHHESSVEVYTNKDPEKYIELEMLGPLHTLHKGEKIERTITYTLQRRTEKDATSEARKILKLGIKR